MIPDLQLDDRRFQDLVSEARTRIARACPEWTEYNVSDPGITLIELFAWMTEMLIYRVNRVPDKLYGRLLDLIGLQLAPPSAAVTEVRFRTAEPVARPVLIADGVEVATPRLGEGSVVFQITEPFTIAPVRPVAYAVRRGDAIGHLEAAQGIIRPGVEQQAAFGAPPAPDDAFHVGFDEPLSRLVIGLSFDAGQARGASVNPVDPPLSWEASGPDGTWLPVEVLEDTTGGFMYGSGTVELQLPARTAAGDVGRRRAHWLRCRLSDVTPSGRSVVPYTAAPDFFSVEAHALGALLEALHAESVEGEVLGVSEGIPGQMFKLQHAPVLRPRPGERLEVKDVDSGDWVQWDLREAFDGSTEFDRHYVVDAAAGVLELGPGIREIHGGWNQYGAVPPRGSVLRMPAYRHGGGRRGNVEAHTLTVLRTEVPGIDTVTNPRSATGGTDGETLADVRQRAPMEMRSRYRAVTAADYEYLTLEATPRVARAHCLAQDGGGPVTIHVLPRIQPADRRLHVEELLPDAELLGEVVDYLDERRTAGATVNILSVSLRGVSVIADVEAVAGADWARVEEDVAHALYTYINPLVGGSLAGTGSGWEFGRSLNQGELYGVIQNIDGVAFVHALRMIEVDPETGARRPQARATQIALEPGELIVSGLHTVRVSRDVG